MEWFNRKTSIAGIQIPDWLTVLESAYFACLSGRLNAGLHIVAPERSKSSAQSRNQKLLGAPGLPIESPPHPR